MPVLMVLPRLSETELLYAVRQRTSETASHFPTQFTIIFRATELGVFEEVVVQGRVRVVFYCAQDVLRLVGGGGG